MSKVWEWLKKTKKEIGDWCFKYLGGLFMEPKNGGMVISLGRTAFVGTLTVMTWFWLFKSVPEGQAQPQLPDGLFATWSVLAGYVFGTKVSDALKLWAGKK